MMNDEETLDSFIPRLCLQHKKRFRFQPASAPVSPFHPIHCLLFAATPLYKIVISLINFVSDVRLGSEIFF